jgi:glycine/D-amino acid oxidase-like deaminating enzyme
MWKASRRAGADLVSTLKRLGVRCDPIERDGIDLALTAEQAEHLRCEYGARQQAGLEGAWLGEGKLLGEVGVGAAGGIRSAGWMLIDPYRACLGLASAAVKRGADIFERSPVTAIEPARLGSEIRTDKGTVSVKTAIVATGAPTAAFKPLARHFNRTVTYAALTPSLEPTLRRQLGRREAVVRDSAAPAHQVTWTADHRMLATGADQVVPSARKRDRALVQRGGQLMYETSLLYPAISGILPDYVWEVAIAETVDGMIYAGPHRNYPHHLFAFGAGHNGPAAAFLAARILVRCCLEAPEPDDALFGFSR